MIVNPTLRLDHAGSEAGRRWRVELVTRRDGRRVFWISGRLGDALLEVRTGRRAVASLGDDAVRTLTAHEVLVPPEAAVAPPRYECRLTGDGRNEPSRTTRTSGPVVANPAFGVRADDRGTALVETGAWGDTMAEYAIDADLAFAYLAVARGDGATVDAGALAALHDVGAVGTAGEVALRTAQDAEQHAAVARQYERASFAIVDGFVRGHELASLQAYCDAVDARGFLDGDHDADGRRRRHVFDDPELRWLLERAARYVTALAGRDMAPTYSFLAFYEGGGRLPAHRDKVHCEHTLSVAVRTPADGAGGPWPLLLGGNERVCWTEGQALLFDGRRLTHARPALADGATATYLVLHVQPDPDKAA